MWKTLGRLGVLLVLIGILCTGCGTGYHTVSTKKGMEMMESEKDYLVVDVRTKSEYEASHIPGAILLPLSEIEGGDVDELPDKDQLLLLYCRTGRRAVQSADLLVKMGYTHVYSFGGIADWEGETVTGSEPGTLNS